MTETAQTYHPAQLQERRQAKKTQIFRRRLGVLAVMGAIAVPAVAVGGARPLAHDAAGAVTNRIEMIKNAFGSNSGDSHAGPQVRQLEQGIDAQKAQNHALELKAEADQTAAASAASGGSAVIEMQQGQ